MRLYNSLVKARLILFVDGRALAMLTLPFMFGGVLAGLAVLWLV